MIVGDYKDIKASIWHNYEIVKHEGVPEKIEELVFPVDFRNVFWEKSEDETIFQSNRPLKTEAIFPEYTSHYNAIVDRERKHLFTIASQSYLLVTNDEAYWMEQAIAKYVFWKPDNNENYDFIPYSKYIRSDRACCNVSIARRIDMNQPDIKDGWFASLTMLNSYNKSVALTYYIGFANSRHKISVIFPENSINFKLKKKILKTEIEST